MDYTPAWVSKIQEKLSIPIYWIKPIFSIQWGWGTQSESNWRNVRIKFLEDTPSLYMNGVLFFGIQWPFFINLMIRWSKTSYLQTHAGWRPVDGAPVIVFRIQADSSAQGGLVSGYLDGAK